MVQRVENHDTLETFHCSFQSSFPDIEETGEDRHG